MYQQILDRHKLPPLAEIDERAQQNATVIKEIDERSHFMESLPYFESSNPDVHRFERRDEMDIDTYTMYEDEGWRTTRPQRGNAAVREVRMGRIGAGYEYDPDFLRRLSADEGIQWTLEVQNKMYNKLAINLIELNLYNRVTLKDAKWGSGLLQWVDKFSDYDKMYKLAKAGRNPFGSEEKCLCLDNSKGASETAASTIESAKSNDDFTSVFAIDFGAHRVFGVYPKEFGLGGFEMRDYAPQLYEYHDATDGLEKNREVGKVRCEIRGGICVENRFAFSAIKNVYLKHKTKADFENEMERLFDNLQKIQLFRQQGNLGGDSNFICAPEILMYFRKYFQLPMVERVALDQEANLTHPRIIGFDSLTLTDGITLHAEKLMKTDEKFAE